MATARKVLELLVAQVLDQLAETRVGAEEMLTNVGAVFGGVALVLAVDGLAHFVEQHTVDIAME